MTQLFLPTTHKVKWPTRRGTCLVTADLPLVWSVIWGKKIDSSKVISTLMTTTVGI